MTTGDWSAPETEVLDAIVSGITNQQAVLATVVAVEGSAYRRPGAKMVIADDTGIGAVTAGCLEDEVLALTEQVLADGAHIERFDLTGTNDVWGLGVGCNGVVDILLEPLTVEYRPVAHAHEVAEDIAVLTVLDGERSDVEQGDHAFAHPTGAADYRGLSFETPTTDWPDELISTLTKPTAEMLAADASDSITVNWEGKTAEIFVDSIHAPPELVVFGSGHDVVPVVELAKQVGFSVTVVTFRGAADNKRFSAADRVITTSPAELHESLAFDTNTYAVVMSHNFVDDRLTLEELLATPVEYVGMVGSRERFREMQDAFAAEGHRFSASERDRIYTPAGLDLGGGTPFHIAQSIVTEITAIHHGRDPQHLTDQTGPIHARSTVTQSVDDD
ncbi:xanthine dehydrogenase accessory factor [Halohasta litchfieldiae]|jgi:xanthine dehydrogenase accessory factor|uniref:Xanthine dehydrogenase accessory factor n=1 Tax=Halohasta litchfieldiae TaxID=1073996 RepID=A0A1H6VZF5_9EURY|nr:XdhC/CoxI family protein [Halohasta litchfieldiae]ATW89368.1 xanthine dehydrogenase accessory factor [Halohasta litchfieldiae]SEJ05960.1 xanthine dehydrogenase accessory factor [Halohasta litchfieldiae]